MLEIAKAMGCQEMMQWVVKASGMEGVVISEAKGYQFCHVGRLSRLLRQWVFKIVDC